jgi:hypothetical protein
MIRKKWKTNYKGFSLKWAVERDLFYYISCKVFKNKKTYDDPFEYTIKEQVNKNYNDSFTGVDVKKIAKCINDQMKYVIDNKIEQDEKDEMAEKKFKENVDMMFDCVKSIVEGK